MDRNKIKEQIRKVKAKNANGEVTISGIHQQLKDNELSENDERTTNKWQTFTEAKLYEEMGKITGSNIFQKPGISPKGIEVSFKKSWLEDSFLSDDYNDDFAYKPKIRPKEEPRKAGYNYETYMKSEFKHTLTYLQYLNYLDEQEKNENKKQKKRKVEIKEKQTYFEVDAINFSALAAIDVGPQYYKAKQEDKEEKEHFLMGNIVDCLLTEPDLFESKFFVDEDDEFTDFPRPQMKKYVEMYIETGDVGKAYDSVGFKKQDMLGVMERYNTEGKNYAEYLTKKKQKLEDNKDKKFITKEQYNKCRTIVDSLVNNRFTKKYFTSYDNVDVVNQLEIYWKMLGNDFKCKLDKIIIDNVNHTIQPIDIKTTGKHTTKFIDSLIAFRYDIQASLYYQGICDYFWNQTDKYKSYKILPFKFIVESTKYPGSPLVFNVPHQLVDLSYDGFTIEGGYLKGWRSLYEDLQWHKENNIWDYSRKDFENEGVVEIAV